MDQLNIISIVLSFFSIIITLLYNRRMAKANENLFKLAYEQDLLMRKEKHFEQIKNEVIKPILRGEGKLNRVLLIDMIRYHYPDIGKILRKHKEQYKLIKSLPDKIVNRALEIIFKTGNKHSIEFNIKTLESRQRILDNLVRLVEGKTIKDEWLVGIRSEKKNNNIYYQLYFPSPKSGELIYESTDPVSVERAKEVFIEAWREVKKDDELLGLVRQYIEALSKEADLWEEITEKLQLLLEQPSTALKLVDNRLCPTMKGEEDRGSSSEEREILEVIEEKILRSRAKIV